MTSKQLYDGIKAKANEAEFETLGITIKTPKAKLQELYDAYLKITREPGIENFIDMPIEDDINKSKDREAAPEEATAETEQTESEPDDFDELLTKVAEAGAGSSSAEPQKDKEPITKTRRKNKKGASSPDSFHVSGYILLLAIDTVFPTALSLANNLIDKKHDKVKPEQLRLSEKDFNELEQLANQAADYLTINLNPLAGFALAALFMYTNNFIAVKAGLVTVNTSV
jgi:hypothetical protein